SSSSDVGSGGGAGALAVTTQAECTWRATADAAWISSISPASGQGSAQVTFQVIPNPDGISRQGTVSINDQQVTIRQAASPCNFALNPSSVQMASAGGSTTLALTATSGCSWQASSTAGWITITSGNSGTGSGSIAITIQANTGAARTGSVLVGGQALGVSQSG